MKPGFVRYAFVLVLARVLVRTPRWSARLWDFSAGDENRASEFQRTVARATRFRNGPRR